MSNSELIEWLKKKAETVTMPGSRKMYQAAVKALEAQQDTISRKAATDALKQQAEAMREWSNRYAEQRKGVLTAVNIVEDLPPAQLGTNLAEVGTDCISRQALLDKFEPWLKVKDYNDGELNMLKAVLYEIRFMPPAQPELKKGKWIRNGWAITCSECGYDMPYTVRRFCPNCGADMRGTNK